jgi:rubredoxin
MTHWMCTNCGYYVQAASPPERCPSCQQACVFNNVTCYRPECGGEENVDPLLVGATLRARTGARAQAAPRPARAVEVLPPVYMEALLPPHAFRSLSEEQSRQFRSLGHTEIFEANAVICSQGAEARKLYLVEEGQVAVHYEPPGGARIPITIISSGGAFGWSALVCPYLLTATVVALSRTRVVAIERDALQALMQADPKIGMAVMEDVASVAASRLRSLELDMIGLVQANNHRIPARV